MNYQRQSKSGLFLMEIILSILFFSVASVVCVQLFAKAHLLSQDSHDRTHAIIYAQNVAECYQAAKGSLSQAQKLIGGTLVEGALIFYYDSAWKPTSDVNEAVYALTLTDVASATTPVAQATLAIGTIDTDPLFTLELAHNRTNTTERE